MLAFTQTSSRRQKTWNWPLCKTLTSKVRHWIDVGPLSPGVKACPYIRGRRDGLYIQCVNLIAMGQLSPLYAIFTGWCYNCVPTSSLRVNMDLNVPSSSLWVKSGVIIQWPVYNLAPRGELKARRRNKIFKRQMTITIILHDMPEVARWFLFKPKIQIWANFWGP
jgi:hypothetical protein